MERADTLRAIAKAVLEFNGQQAVEEKIAEGNLSGAECYILGGLDFQVECRMIGEREARTWYAALNLDLERVRRLRQEPQKPDLPPAAPSGVH